MKTCDIIRCKRQALGMTQQEIANIVGVSSNTISNFESGKEVSVPIFNGIKIGIENAVRELTREEYLQYSIVYHAYLLAYETDGEKLKTLNYMLLDMAKLSLELSNKTYESEP